MDGDAAEVQRYFQDTCEQIQDILRIPKEWKRWATADRDPIGTWVFGRAALLSDAAHPMVQYLAQCATPAATGARHWRCTSVPALREPHGWCATTCGRTGPKRGFTMRWNGFMAGTPITA